MLLNLQKLYLCRFNFYFGKIVDMKKYTILFVLLLAALSPFAQGLKVFISHKAFCTHNLQPYIEYTFIVGGNSVNYVPNKHNKFEAADRKSTRLNSSHSWSSRMPSSA